MPFMEFLCLVPDDDRNRRTPAGGQRLVGS